MLVLHNVNGLDRRKAESAALSGFEIDEPRLTFYGACHKCRVTTGGTADHY